MMDRFGGKQGWRGVGGWLADQPLSAKILAAATVGVLLLAVLLVLSGRSPAGLSPRPDALADEPMLVVRTVRLASNATIAGPGRIRLSFAESQVDLATPVAVTCREGRLVLTGSAGDPVTLDPGQLAELSVAGGDKAITIDGRPQPGAVVLRPQVGGDRFDIGVRLGMERYVEGVVSAEMYTGWPIEAFKAQAVCARSYALHERGLARQIGRWFDIDRGDTAQQFDAAPADGRVREAITTTRGSVLEFRGELLRAYYSSTCGGRAASAADTWATGPGYEFHRAVPLQAASRMHSCQASPTYRWSTLRTRPGLSARLRSWGKAAGIELGSIGVLRAVEVSQTNEAGRPSHYRLSDDAGGSFEITAEQLRLACNAPIGSADNITTAQRVLSGDVVFEFRGSAIEITGRGFGHGVGLCQFGAAALADRGDDHREILAVFYPGATIGRAY